jgi:hypothetical protein
MCERTLVTLLRNLGPWKESVYLVGGLVPRYLISPPTDAEDVPQHIGTTDVDLVLNVALLADIEAYRRLEQNLKDMGFVRGKNDEGAPQHFKWLKSMGDGATIVVDLLCDAPSDEGGKVAPVPGEKRLSALKIPGAYLVLEDYIELPLTAELLDDGGVAMVRLRVANVAPFLVLKCLAYEDRVEEKDAYDIVYCLSYYSEGAPSVAREFAGLQSRFPGDQFIERALYTLRHRFASDSIEGHRKDGPHSYARFLTNPGRSERDAVHRRDACAVVEAFLTEIARLSSTG